MTLTPTISQREREHAELIDLAQDGFLAPYLPIWEAQLERVKERQAGGGVDTFLFVEHDHVITLGRGRDARQQVIDAGDIPVVEVERGGDATYHGPGQLVVYPILLLREGERDLHRYLRCLEAAVVCTLNDFGVAATSIPGKTGVWVEGHKIASIGVACRKWVTFHGLALNISTDLLQFTRIHPCGFSPTVMTSFSALLGRPVSINEVKPRLTRYLGDVLGRSIQCNQRSGFYSSSGTSATGSSSSSGSSASTGSSAICSRS